MFYFMTNSTHFIYGYMASDIWLRTNLIARKETRCRHIGYSFQLTARVILYTPSHRLHSTYHSLCYTNRGALVGTRNSSMVPPHEGSIRRPIAPLAKVLTTELHLAPSCEIKQKHSTEIFWHVFPLSNKHHWETIANVSLCTKNLIKYTAQCRCLCYYY